MIGEPPRQDRSDEEREAARQARERARAEREAKRAAKEAKRGGREPAAASPPAEASQREPLRPQHKSREPLRPQPKPREPLRPQPRDDGGPPPRDAAEAAAARTGAAGRPSIRDRADALLASRRGDGSRGGSTGERSPGRAGGFRRRRIAALVVLALLAAGSLWLVLALFQPGKGEGKGAVAITIPKGAGVGDIGDLLAGRGVVDSGFMFEIRARLGGKSGDLKPGIYNLRRDMSYGAAIDVLTGGPSPDLINVTIPEGTARRQVAGRVKQAGLDGSYVRASTRSRELNPRRYGARNAKDLEGFLFPATYQLRKGSTAKTLVDKQLTAFEQNWSKVDLKAARRANLTPYDVLIIASLVEREAQVDKERPIVASVVYNRLRAGMNLGIDATVRYALNNWTAPLKRSELQSSSSYNTYNHPGLPPGPIGNPGLASMRAAARPAHTKFLYYVVKPNTCGEHSFAATADEHDRNVARYNKARAANGGQSPTSC